MRHLRRPAELELVGTRLLEADAPTFGEITTAVEDAVREKYGDGADWVWIRDLTADWAVY